MPKGVRSRWRPLRRRNDTASGSGSRDAPMSEPSFVQDVPRDECEANGAEQPESLLRQIARALWLPSYAVLFAMELEHNRALVGGASMPGGFVQRSRYASRLKGEEKAAWERRQLSRAGRDAAVRADRPSSAFSAM